MVLWLGIGGTGAVLLIAVLAVGVLARINGGHLQIDQLAVGRAAFEPWERMMSLDAAVVLRNSDREMPLRPVAIEIVSYRSDKVRHDEQIAGRIVWEAGAQRILRPRESATVTVHFEMSAAALPNSVLAEVRIRDAFDDGVRGHLQFTGRTSDLP
jgi:hypothetical protein